jgi:hypothetical protein
MAGFTIGLIVAAVVWVAAAAYGLLRPRGGHQVDQRAIDSDPRNNRARLTHDTTMRGQDGSSGMGSGGL